MTLPSPLRYTPDLEQMEPDEAKTVGELNETFDVILDTTSTDYGHAVRSVHAKAHAVLEGTLTVRSDLLPELAQGLFATPGDHKVFLRFSTNAGDILNDAISLPRGLAIKVLDVDGERLPGAEGTSQDFVLVNGPVFQTDKAGKFLANLKLLAKTTDVAEGGKTALSAVLRTVGSTLAAVGLKSSTIESLGGAPNVEPLGETYFSVTPFRFGEYVAKFSVAPLAPELKALTGREIDASDRPDAIREEMRAEMATIDALWEMRVQLLRDLDKQPVEDPTTEWKEEDSPFLPVATISAPRQDSWDEGRVDLVNERLRFSVWTGLAAHQPLGNINRARRDTYRHSADYRARFNGCPIHEPS